MDTGAGENFLSIENGENQGSPGLKKFKNVFESATQYRYNKGSLHTVVNIEQELELVVTEAPDLNLLGRSAIRQLETSVDKLVKPV